jgi:hypothetical protein
MITRSLAVLVAMLLLTSCEQLRNVKVAREINRNLEETERFFSHPQTVLLP